MTWIDVIPWEQAEGRLRKLYERIRDAGGNIDNIMMAHSLRPHTMEGHMTLYKYVLHHSANRLPRWLMEALGVYVSALNGCGYCVAHHLEGLRRLLKDDARADRIGNALQAGEPEAAFDGAELAAMAYARALALDPADMTGEAVRNLRDAGYDDGEILEINQVVAYFAYANRTVQGLGVTTEGDVLGTSPSASDNPEDWSHR